jgi:hypothetical protein
MEIIEAGDALDVSIYMGFTLTRNWTILKQYRGIPERGIPKS